jgi:hypothetical protein
MPKNLLSFDGRTDTKQSHERHLCEERVIISQAFTAAKRTKIV